MEKSRLLAQRFGSIAKVIKPKWLFDETANYVYDTSKPKFPVDINDLDYQERYNIEYTGKSHTSNIDRSLTYFKR